MKKVLKKAVICFFAMLMISATASSFVEPIQVEASVKSNKAVREARKYYYATQKNLKRYKKINSSSGCMDYYDKGNHLKLTIVRPGKDILSMKNTVCEYYYNSKQRLVFAFAYTKTKGRLKEYRVYYMGQRCYRYIGPDKKVHTYGKGKSPYNMSGMPKKLYHNGYMNLHYLGFI